MEVVDMRYSVIPFIFLLASCATGPSQAQLEYTAFDRVISERVAKGQITPAEADLARTQYSGSQQREAQSAYMNYLLMRQMMR
jgi:YD repeat-containing protein